MDDTSRIHFQSLVDRRSRLYVTYPIFIHKITHWVGVESTVNGFIEMITTASVYFYYDLRVFYAYHLFLTKNDEKFFRWMLKYLTNLYQNIASFWDFPMHIYGLKFFDINTNILSVNEKLGSKMLLFFIVQHQIFVFLKPYNFSVCWMWERE